jgi:hypothetical protein
VSPQAGLSGRRRWSCRCSPSSLYRRRWRSPRSPANGVDARFQRTSPHRGLRRRGVRPDRLALGRNAKGLGGQEPAARQGGDRPHAFGRTGPLVRRAALQPRRRWRLQGHAAPSGADRLVVDGCVLFVCRTQVWRRADPDRCPPVAPL